MTSEAFRNLIEQGLSLVPEDKRPPIEEYLAYLLNEFSCNSTSWKGYHFQPGFNSEIAQYIYNEWEPREDDIIVASFPKSGTNWTKEIVNQILYRNDDCLLKETGKLFPMICFLDIGPKEKFAALEHFKLPRRVFCTHMPAPLFNFQKFKRNKVFYITRNPKDQAVSWFNFAMTFPYRTREPWSELMPENEQLFYDNYLAGKHRLFSKDGEGCLEHVRGWYDHKNDDNVMFLCYEDMKEDTCNEIQKIGKFIGEDLTDGEAETIAKKSNIDSLKKKFNENESFYTIFRKGEVGGWKNHLTVAQSELIDSNAKKILCDTDIRFKYQL